MLTEDAFCFGIVFWQAECHKNQELFGFPKAKMGRIVLQQCILMFRIFGKQIFSGLFWRTNFLTNVY
jgi:hypothetical protein